MGPTISKGNNKIKLTFSLHGEVIYSDSLNNFLYYFLFHSNLTVISLPQHSTFPRLYEEIKLERGN